MRGVGLSIPRFDAPEKVNADAYANWFYRLKPANAADLSKLLDAAGYIKTVGEN